MKKLDLLGTKAPKKLKRSELKNVFGGDFGSGGVGCNDACTLGSGDVCTQYGLTCGIFMSKKPDGTLISCYKCM